MISLSNPFLRSIKYNVANEDEDSQGFFFEEVYLFVCGKSINIICYVYSRIYFGRSKVIFEQCTNFVLETGAESNEKHVV